MQMLCSLGVLKQVARFGRNGTLMHKDTKELLGFLYTCIFFFPFMHAHIIDAACSQLNQIQGWIPLPGKKKSELFTTYLALNYDKYVELIS